MTLNLGVRTETENEWLYERKFFLVKLVEIPAWLVQLKIPLCDNCKEFFELYFNYMLHFLKKI